MWNQRPALGKALEGSEGGGTGGFWGKVPGPARGCGEVWRGLGAIWGSASLACPKTLASSVEMWEVRAAMWVWLLCLERFGGSEAGLVALARSRDCGTKGGPSGGLEQQPPTNSTSRLQYTAGEASGGVGSEQSLRKTSSRDARRSRIWIKEKKSTFLGHFGTIPASGPWRVRGGLWGSGYSGASKGRGALVLVALAEKG